MYKVSIGIPVYNAAAYVERALLSALNQTLPDIEYIIVDDKGTDNSMDIVRRVISEHPRGKDVRIIEQEVNCGVGVARDTMIANATAPYIYFMDSDDEISGDAIDLLYNVMEKSDGAQVVQSEYQTIPTGGRRPADVERSAKCHIEKTGVEIIQAYQYHGFLSAMSWNKLYDLNFLKAERIHFGDLRVLEDDYFSMQIFCKASKYIYIPYVTYFYYENESSLFAFSRKRQYHTPRYRYFERYLEKMLGFGRSLTDEVRLVFEQRLLGIIYGEIKIMIELPGMTGKEKRQCLRELDALLHNYPFLRRYRTAKAQLFWMVFQLPIPLRTTLIWVADLLV